MERKRDLFSGKNNLIFELKNLFFTQSDQKKWMPGWSSKWNLESGLSDYFGQDI